MKSKVYWCFCGLLKGKTSHKCNILNTISTRDKLLPRKAWRGDENSFYVELIEQKTYSDLFFLHCRIIRSSFVEMFFNYITVYENLSCFWSNVVYQYSIYWNRRYLWLAVKNICQFIYARRIVFYPSVSLDGDWT